MDEKQFSLLQSKLDALIRLTAMSALQGKSLKEQVSVLASLELTPKQIADILGKTPNHISVTLHEIRKSESAKKPETTPAQAPPSSQPMEQAGEKK